MPALARAAAISLDHRGDEATGWGTAWRSILWARLGDAERAHKILAGLIGPQRTYATLLDSCPPFQIDGNFGGAVAIMEMLLQSWGGQIRLLPALPNTWPNGRVRGLAAKGGVLVDMEWRDSTLRHVAVRGAAGQRLVLRNRDRTADITLDRLGRFVATEI